MLFETRKNDIAYILEAAADVNRTDKYNQSALHYAAQMGFDHFIQSKS